MAASLTTAQAEKKVADARTAMKAALVAAEDAQNVFVAACKVYQAALAKEGS